MKIVWRTSASRDLIAITDYLAHESETLAYAMADRFDATLKQLSRFPRMGHPCDDAQIRVFYLSETPYRIYYRPGPERLELLRILHCSRRTPRPLR